MNEYKLEYTAYFAGRELEREGYIKAVDIDDVQKKIDLLALAGGVEITVNKIQLCTL